MRAEAEDQEAAAAEYAEAMLKVFGTPPDEYPRFDLVLLGLGIDGHTASLFPNSPALKETARWVVAVHAAAAAIPRRLTMTLPVFNAARRVIFLSAGAGEGQGGESRSQGGGGARRLMAAARRPWSGRRGLAGVASRPGGRGAARHLRGGPRAGPQAPRSSRRGTSRDPLRGSCDSLARDDGRGRVRHHRRAGPRSCAGGRRATRNGRRARIRAALPPSRRRPARGRCTRRRAHPPRSAPGATSRPCRTPGSTPSEPLVVIPTGFQPSASRVERMAAARVSGSSRPR